MPCQSISGASTAGTAASSLSIRIAASLMIRSCRSIALRTSGSRRMACSAPPASLTHICIKSIAAMISVKHRATRSEGIRTIPGDGGANLSVSHRAYHDVPLRCRMPLRGCSGCRQDRKDRGGRLRLALRRHRCRSERFLCYARQNRKWPACAIPRAASGARSPRRMFRARSRFMHQV
jgi:hypothetical protein